MVFGGVGSGLYGMLVMVVLTVFIIGLMVGRTPEYLGKKIESSEMKMGILAVLMLSGGDSVRAAPPSPCSAGTVSISNPGPHGLSEILYAFSEAAGNNGTAFAGINGNTDFYNWSLAVAMLVGRFMMKVPALALAGSLVLKKTVPASAGTFPTSGLLFVALLIGVILIVGALTFFPALALGPIVEHLLMLTGKSY